MPVAQMPLTASALQAPLRSSASILCADMPDMDTLHRKGVMLSLALIRRTGALETDQLHHLHCQHAARPDTTARLPPKLGHCSAHLAARRLASQCPRCQGWHVLWIRLGGGSALDPRLRGLAGQLRVC